MLKILPRYFLRELMKTFTYAFIAVMLIIFVSFALDTMLSRGVNILRTPKVVGYLLLQSFPYALPTALLASVIMTYGRFSGDNEILAIRSSGIHLQWVTTPTVLLGVVFCFITLIVSGNLLPATEGKLRKIKEETIRILVEQLGTGRESITFSGWEIYVGERHANLVKDVLVVKTDNEAMTQLYWGKEGVFTELDQPDVFQLELKDVKSARFTADDPSDFHWMKVEKGVVPLVLGGKSETTTERPKYHGIFTLFRERRELADKIIRHSQRFPNPSKAAAALRRSIEELKGEIKSLQEDIDRGKETILKLAKGEEDAQREAQVFAKQAEEIQATLHKIESQRKELEQKIATIQAEIEGKALEIEKVKAKGETTTPEEKQQADSLAREKLELEGRLERLKSEVAELTSQIEPNQRKFKEAKSKAEELSTIASQRRELKLKAEEEMAATIEAKREREAALKEKVHMREEAKIQDTFFDVECLLHYRLALSFAPLAFVLIAIPLGIMCRHGHILVGFSIGIGLLIVYYALFTAGRVLAEGRYFYIAPSYWAADIFLATIGIVLLGRLFSR